MFKILQKILGFDKNVNFDRNFVQKFLNIFKFPHIFPDHHSWIEKLTLNSIFPSLFFTKTSKLFLIKSFYENILY